jgi:hypothetical protein
MKWTSLDIAQLGRAAGGVIVVTGVGLAVWNGMARPGIAADDTAKASILEALRYASSGLVVILVAEIASRMGRRSREPMRDSDDLRESASDEAEPPPLLPLSTAWAVWNRVNVVQLGRGAGALITLLGIVVSAWAAIDARQAETSFFGSAYVAREFLGSALFHSSQGILVIALAEVAGRIAWRDEEAEAAPNEA